jgi:methionine sulfoxide reductase heme-binding subunit
MSADTLWYLARGSGTVSLILLTVVVALGIGTRAGGSFAGMHRLAVTSVHRSVALLSVVFLAVHVTALKFDPYAQLKLVDLVLPFTSIYRPLWVGLGAVGLDLLLALMITSLLRERIGLRVWKAVHWLAYAMWPVALAHAIGSGSDRSAFWMLAIDAVCVLTVLGVLLSTHPVLRAIVPSRTPADSVPGSGAGRVLASSTPSSRRSSR